MKKKSIIAVYLAAAMIMSALPGCGSTGGKVTDSQEQTSQEEVLQESIPASEDEAVMDRPEKKNDVCDLYYSSAVRIYQYGEHSKDVSGTGKP